MDQALVFLIRRSQNSLGGGVHLDRREQADLSSGILVQLYLLPAKGKI